MECKYCGSKEVQYLGIEDGAGDYGMAIAELWFCLNCESHFEDYQAYSDLSEADESQEGEF